jgi:hypothetical protein
MRCRSCDSPYASWQAQWEEYYCEECLDEIYDALSEYDEDLDELDIIKELYYDD